MFRTSLSAPILCLLLVEVLCLPVLAEDPKDLWMKITSEVPGNLFVEGEPVAFNLTVVGGGKDPATGTWAELDLVYRVTETDGDWSTQGALGRFTATRARDVCFELPLPGRGLFELVVEGRATTGVTGSKSVPLAVTHRPHPPTSDSRWGVFLIPYGGADATPEQAEALAENMRRLGVSWVRLNFWATSFRDVNVVAADPPEVRASYPSWKAMAEALHRRGISIMGTICHVPEEISSQPGVIGPRAGDAGPQWARVMPRDLGLWEAFLADMASQFKEQITYWETWNEPNLPRRYWAGSREEFHALVPHTVAGLKRGNPDARIVFSGFSSSDHEGENPLPVADAALGAGIAELVDVFSAHNMDQQEHVTGRWRALLERHGLSTVPLWDTEPKNLLPFRGYDMGVKKTFHFLHIAPAGNYGAFDALVRSDLTPLANGLTYSTAARFIGARPVASAFKTPTFDVYVFADEGRTTVAYRPTMRGLLPGKAIIRVPEASRNTLEWLDHLGRSRPTRLDGGRLTVPLENIGFITARGPLEVEDVVTPRAKPEPIQHVYAFNRANVSGPWNPERRTRGWINDRILAIFSEDDPVDLPYSATLPMDVPGDGSYDVFISADIWTRLQSPRSISSWQWRIDARDWQAFEGPVPMLWRENGPRNEANTPVRDDEVFFLGGQHVLQKLGRFDLDAGQHTFTLELTGRRETPDQAYCIYFDAVVLRPVAPGNRGSPSS